jgi:hypothetical protein
MLLHLVLLLLRRRYVLVASAGVGVSAAAAAAAAAASETAANTSPRRRAAPTQVFVVSPSGRTTGGLPGGDHDVHVVHVLPYQKVALVRTGSWRRWRFVFLRHQPFGDCVALGSREEAVEELLLCLHNMQYIASVSIRRMVDEQALKKEKEKVKTHVNQNLDWIPANFEQI